MSRKRISSQKPLGSGVSATPKSRAARRPASTLLRKHRVVAALALVTMLIAATAILAQRGKQKSPTVQSQSQQDKNASQPTGEMSPESLTSPSLPSKEYIHGPGGKVIATEEMVTFTDVTIGSDFYDDIYRIAARGVTLGCTATEFCPNDVVTRGQMAAFIIRALGEYNPPDPATQRFTDVPPSNPFYKFIDRMAVLGITLGCTATTYCPDDRVLHQAIAAFIMRARGEFNPPTPPTQRFNDVPPANVFYNFIERMGYFDIWHGQGCPGTNNYCPTAPVTRRQMAHILVRAFGI